MTEDETKELEQWKKVALDMADLYKGQDRQLRQIRVELGAEIDKGNDFINEVERIVNKYKNNDTYKAMNKSDVIELAKLIENIRK